MFDFSWLETDSYKLGHHKMYPSDTTNMSSYIEARGDGSEEVVFFGLQVALKKIGQQGFGGMVFSFCKEHGLEMNKDLAELSGKPLPLRIQAVPEGTPVPTGHVLVQVEATDPKYAFLVPYIEGFLLSHVWYASSVATRSWRIKKYLKGVMDRTGSSDKLPFMLHDFGYRGCAPGAAWIGGLAHLISFSGTDTLPALLGQTIFYENKDLKPAGYSIYATEHSVMTCEGRNGEKAVVRRLLSDFLEDKIEGPLMAMVIDSYDDENFIKNILFKDCWDLVSQLEAKGKTLVLRPDSGDPVWKAVDVLNWIQQTGKVNITRNEKGFKELPAWLAVIQGDGLSENKIKALCTNLEESEWAISNLAFGMGGGLLQDHGRDDYRFAMKLSAIQYNNGAWQDVYKDPKDSSKTSKKGRLVLVKDISGAYQTLEERWKPGGVKNELITVYDNGLKVEYSFDQVRKNADVL